MTLDDGRRLSVAFSEETYSGWDDFSGSVPDGFVAPRNAFGRIWTKDITIGSADAILRDLTGYPTGEERDISLEIAQDDANRVYAFDGQTVIIPDFFAIEAKTWQRG
jgi:hypothetical protein